MNKKEDKYREFRGVFTKPLSQDGVPVEARNSSEVDPYEEVKVYWPVTATIINVHYANSPSNRSLMDRIGANQSILNSIQQEITLKDGAQETIKDPSLEFSPEAGNQFECDILIDKGFGVAERDLFRPNVPMSLSFGGVHNYGFVTPRATTNSSYLGTDRRYDGDKVIVKFIGGNIDQPIIIGYKAHDLNVEDSPRYFPGYDSPESGAHFRINGANFFIDDHGNVSLDTCNADARLYVDPKTGQQTKIEPNRKEVEVGEVNKQPPGVIQVTSKSNMLLSASYGKTDVNVGNIVLQSKTETLVRSETQDIKVYTNDSDKDVELQGVHGGLRPAARKYDKVKITAGNDNDLFTWCALVVNTLEQVGGQLVTAGGELTNDNLVYAGSMLQGLAATAPSYAEGRIIEGSPYVTVGGVATSQDDPPADTVAECTTSEAASFAAAATGASDSVNSATAAADTLAIAREVALWGEVAGLVPEGTGDAIKEAIPLSYKYMASNPDPAPEAPLYLPQGLKDAFNTIAGLVNAANWLSLGPADLVKAVDAITLLANPADAYDITPTQTTITNAIADGTATQDSFMGGSYNQAIDECVDKKLEA